MNKKQEIDQANLTADQQERRADELWDRLQKAERDLDAQKKRTAEAHLAADRAEADRQEYADQLHDEVFAANRTKQDLEDKLRQAEATNAYLESRNTTLWNDLCDEHTRAEKAENEVRNEAILHDRIDYLEGLKADSFPDCCYEDKKDTTPRAEVLDEANTHIHGDRNTQYGPPTVNFERIAGFWTTYLLGRGKLPEDEYIKPHEVADMNILQKVARNIEKPKRDNYVDIAGYAACGWETVAEADNPRFDLEFLKLEDFVPFTRRTNNVDSRTAQDAVRGEHNHELGPDCGRCADDAYHAAKRDKIKEWEEAYAQVAEMEEQDWLSKYEGCNDEYTNSKSYRDYVPEKDPGSDWKTDF